MMLAASSLLGECLPSPKIEAKEDELASKGLDPIVDRGEGGGGANTGCAICKGILSRGASGLKKGLKMEAAKEC